MLESILQDIAKKHSGGITGLARDLDTPVQRLINKLNPDCDSDHPSARDFVRIQEYMNDWRALEWLANTKAKRDVVPLEANASADIMDSLMSTVVNGGNMVDLFKGAWKDHRISTREEIQIRERIAQFRVAINEFEATVSSLARAERERQRASQGIGG